MTRRLLALLLLVALAGCARTSPAAPQPGGGTAAASGPPSAQTVTVHGTDRLQFVPQTVTARVGTLTLTLANGGVPHDLVFAQPGLGSIPPTSGPQTRSVVVHFTHPGRYVFTCTLHPGMQGVVVVTG